MFSPKALAGRWYFRQLFVDGKRRGRARGPNRGYHRIARLLPGPKDAHGKAIAREKFVFAPGDLEAWRAVIPEPSGARLALGGLLTLLLVYARRKRR